MFKTFLVGLILLLKMKDADGKESKERQATREVRKKEIEDNVIDSLRTPKKPVNLAEEAKYLGRKLF